MSDGSLHNLMGKERSELLNRTVNVAIAILALIALLPVMIVIAIGIKVTSRGSILYVQERVGVDRRRRQRRAAPRNGNADRRGDDVGGVQFPMYKFRSMRMDAEKGTGAVWAAQNDPRVTSIGHFLRRTRLDELPQLWNVVCGDMNIVGPRPERPSIFAELRRSIDNYPLRQRARPGITGWAQINRAYDESVDDVRDKVKYDLEYLARQSLVEDLKIMARTLPVMVNKKGSR